MKDRVPVYPGRVTLTPVSGQANTYDMVRADQPTQEGTPLNKNTLLKDATAQSYGGGATMVPDDVLAMLAGSLKVEQAQVPTGSVGVDWVVNSPVSTGISQARCMAYGDGMFFVGDDTNAVEGVAVSTDNGANWTFKDVGSSAISANAMAYGNGRLVIVSNSSVIFTIDTSDFSVLYSGRADSNYRTYIAVCYGGGVFVALPYGGNYCYTSPDGVSWQKKNMPITANWTCCAYGNGIFVALSDMSNSAYSTDGGETWTSFTMPGPSSGKWQAITFDGSKFVAIMQAYNNAAYSTDGHTFTLSSGLPYSGTWFSIASGSGYVCAAGIESGSGGSSNFAISDDGGATWKAVSGITISGSNYNLPIAYGNGAFVSVAYNGGSIYISQNTYASQYTLQTPVGADVTDQVAQALGSVKQALITYVGTGTYGEDNPTTITFPFVPKLVLIQGVYVRDPSEYNGLYTIYTPGYMQESLTLVYDAALGSLDYSYHSNARRTLMIGNNNYKTDFSVSTDGKTLKLWVVGSNLSAVDQLNADGFHYYCYILG